MINLLKADFIRIKKDILIKIIFLVAIGFALFTSLLYLAMMGLFNEEDQDMLGFMFNGKGIFTSSFSMSNNMGLVIPIILAIFMCKDFSFLTIRNKIIMGQPRHKIYLSSYIVSSIIGLTLLWTYALANLGFGSLFLGYATEVAKNEVWICIRTLLLGSLVYLVLFAILTFMAYVTKNMALTIITSISIVLIETIVYAILIGFSAVNAELKIIDFINKLLLFSQTSSLGDDSYTWYIIISSIVKIGLITTAGILIFKKSDIK